MVLTFGCSSSREREDWTNAFDIFRKMALPVVGHPALQAAASTDGRLHVCVQQHVMYSYSSSPLLQWCCESVCEGPLFTCGSVVCPSRREVLDICDSGYAVRYVSCVNYSGN